MIKKITRNLRLTFSSSQILTQAPERFSFRDQRGTQRGVHGFTTIVIIGLAVFTMLAPQPSTALEGFNPKMVDRFIELQNRDFDPNFGFPNNGDQDFQGVVESAAIFRLVAANDIQKLPEVFPDAFPGTLEPFLNRDPPESSQITWPYFFRGSLPVIENFLGPIIRVGFYNPMVDGWVVTEWGKGQGGQQLMGLKIIPGEVMRGQALSLDNLQWWTQKLSGGFIDVLQKTTARSLKAFQERNLTTSPGLLDSEPPPLQGSIEQVFIESRIATVLLSLLPLRNPDLKELVYGLRVALASGQLEQLQNLAPAMDSTILRRIVGLPSSVRANFEPTSVMASRQGYLLTLGLSNSARWLMIAEVTPRADQEEIVFNHLTIVDLKEDHNEKPGTQEKES